MSPFENATPVVFTARSPTSRPNSTTTPSNERKDTSSRSSSVPFTLSTPTMGSSVAPARRRAAAACAESVPVGARSDGTTGELHGATDQKGDAGPDGSHT
jgi:hypothetical protein